MATDDPKAMTPAAAVARHIEWLEFALVAARDEETRRRDRLARATDGNRDKRTVRLAEVTAEVRELAALVEGLQALRVQPAAAKTRATKPVATKPVAAKPVAAKPTTPKRKAAKAGRRSSTTRRALRATRSAGSGPASSSGSQA